MSELSKFDGISVMITGGGHGIGAELARALAEAGARLCIADLNPDRAVTVVEEITAAGGTAFDWQGDTSNRFQVSAMIEKTRDHYGKLDLMLHTTHVMPHIETLKMDEWDLRRTAEVNVVGSYFCLQLVGRVMADEGGGLMALIVPPAQPGPGYTAFNATQAAMRALAEGFNRDLGASGVHTIAIEEAVLPDLLDQLAALLPG